MPFDSASSKVSKRAITAQCIESALTNSSAHLVQESFNSHIGRLQPAGIQCSNLSAVSVTFSQKLKGTKRPVSARAEKRPKVVYVHKVAHNFKSLANRYNVSVVFSASHNCQGYALAARDFFKNLRAENGMSYTPSSLSTKFSLLAKKCIKDRSVVRRTDHTIVCENGPVSN